MTSAMRHILIPAAALAALCTAVRADPPSPNTPTTAAPVEVPNPTAPHRKLPWIRVPSALDMAVRFPVRAEERRVSGRATLLCKVANDGTLSACTVAAETPPGYDFKWAALKLVPHFQLDVTSPKGDPKLIGTTVSVSIGFRAPHFSPYAGML
jgi:periplasmic protein TonB